MVRIVEVFEWSSYSCNNSSDHRLVADFKSAAVARKMAKELTAFLAAHAAEHDAAEEPDEEPDEPSRASVAFGKKYGVRWSEFFSIATGQPTVATLDHSVVVFHGYTTGFGPDLPKVLQKAGGKLREETEGPPVIHVELKLPAGGGRLRGELEALFAQRRRSKLSSWKRPAWAKSPMLGDSIDAALVFDGDACAFTLPLDAADIGNLRAYLEKHKAQRLSLGLASAADIEKLQAREHAATAGAPAAKRAAKPTAKPAATSAKPAAAPAKPAAIPKTAPKLTIAMRYTDTSTFCPRKLASNGSQLFAVGFNGVTGQPALRQSKDGKQLDELGAGKVADHTDAVLAVGTEVWICGKGGVQRSTDQGRSFQPVAMPKGLEAGAYSSPTFGGIARDATGAVWVGGYNGQGFTSTDCRRFVQVRGLDDANVNAVVPLGEGVLIASDNGRLYFGKAGKVQATSLRARSGLHDACVTPRGTLVVVGHGDSKGSIYRSEDGGQSFAQVKHGLNKALYCIAALPDGRLIAGGREATIAVSYNDGKSFQRVPHPKLAIAIGVYGGKERELTFACAHDDAVYLGNPFQHLVRVE